jgi:hypothetical protein
MKSRKVLAQCAKEELSWQKMKTKIWDSRSLLRDVGLCSRMSEKTESGKT